MANDIKESLYPGQIFCQYTAGKCPEAFSIEHKNKVLFLYPSVPPIIAATIESAATILSSRHANKTYLTWKDLKTEGRVIFCEICKAIFSSSYLVCDITTLNFNLLFEIGYIYGLSKPLIPIFDTSFGEHKNLLTKIGLLDTVGYKSFLNSQDLTTIVENDVSDVTLQRSSQVDTFRPVFYLKTPLDTEGSLRITSSLKKSAFRYRVYDPKETFRLPISKAVQEVDRSFAVIAHLLSPDRREALIHNARCAFVAGFAMASQKRVLLIQEGIFNQPIDYREIAREYEDLTQINVIMSDFLKELVDALQSPVKMVESVQRSILEDIDIGDIAAENEIENLRSYYVRTGQFTAARKGHAQLVIGRKGSGKTALFYALRHHIGAERYGTLILDLKPEGYQFAKLRDMLLSKFSVAIKQHTLTAVWDYVLLLELAHKIIDDKKEKNAAHRDQEKWKTWDALKTEYTLHRNIEEGDFSERLSALIDAIVKRAPHTQIDMGTPEITQMVFAHDIKRLRDLIVAYLHDKDEVWVLFDNLDKNWKINQADDYEAVILRCLLDASRKLQKMFIKEGIDFHSIVFIRNDIYTFFLDKTTDRGKDQVIYLDWDDPDLFREIFRLRINRDQTSKETLDQIWARIFDLHVLSESSFNYIIERTLLRPRDFLLFIHYALQTAINRGHGRILQEDILHAEESYSRDLFEGLLYEIRDISPNLENALYGFLEKPRTMFESELISILRDCKIPEDKIEQVISTFLWFCFLGINSSDMTERYAYSTGYDIKMLLKFGDWTEKDQSEKMYAIHPGFSRVLELKK